MRSVFAAVALVSLSGCLSAAPDDSPTVSPGPAPPTEALSWGTRAEMPVPRTEVSCAGRDGKIYVLGGFDSTNTATSLFHGYDSATDRWTQLASFPIPIHHTGLVAYQGAVLVFGGYTGSFPFLGTNGIWRYDPAADAWSMDGSLPRARGAHATILQGPHVLLVGGAPQQPGQETYASVDVYDLAQRTFRTGPSLGATREHLAGAAAEGMAVAVGGRRMSLENFDSTESLAEGGDSWIQEDPLPTPRGGLAAAAWGSRVFVFGGERSGGTHDETEAFDAATRTWTEHERMPHARHGLCAATLEDGIHVIGGGPQPGLSVSAHHDVLRLDSG